MIPLLLRRGAFVFYALIVVTATHWPNLKVEGPLPRTDLWAHFAAFSVWMILAGFAALFGPALSKRNLTRTFIVAVVYIFVDELTQGIPGLGRVVDPADIAANFVGLCIGIGVLVLLRRTTLGLVLGPTERREPIKRRP